MNCIMKCLLCLAMALATASAFMAPSPVMHKAARSAGALKMTEDTYWEGKAPPSKVLGPVVSQIPSPALGVISLICLGVGTYSVHESNIFHTLTADTINPGYIIGSLLTPVAWGTHVASWIQKQNGK
ncbi:hypothetical protein JKP88DRAFT_228024 [Tribonema minus]|uniref:Uncharacterized protein n=2 Tax=Tribonema minus TaxID=303371 RepID=A0A836C871_9STRA|nr:hypothetical protein JKP88DRAFT_228024 [Tribonema minus]|eukprot:TRINITY_DN783_c0_g1_i4.p1 TRINITY_DN783_c0_g1~~TRINITY_DN783_c0_g1_i4.p1  ORF type:complete len:127 (+),score=32.94 TRINITY_DN783_c0_g1_i4:608-988(+)